MKTNTDLLSSFGLNIRETIHSGVVNENQIR